MVPQPLPAEGPTAARIAALRERGAAQREPLRLHVVEALAARAAREQGALRRVLDARVDALAAALERDLGAAPARALPRSLSPAVKATPLAGLLAAFDPEPLATGAAPAAVSRVPELKAVTAYRATWTQWRADRQLQQSLASVPRNPGPLNSHAVVLRALTRMRSLSPQHLNRYVAYLETLAWLEHTYAALQAAETRRPAPRERRRKGSP